jgi:hypothetical protein
MTLSQTTVTGHNISEGPIIASNAPAAETSLRNCRTPTIPGSATGGSIREKGLGDVLRAATALNATGKRNLTGRVALQVLTRL